MTTTDLGASFRDPAGYVRIRDGIVERDIMPAYQPEWEALAASGLLADLHKRGLLVAHEEVAPAAGAWKTLRPEKLPFISYPYEWCFDQLKDAALLTLEIQRRAFEKGLSLKDASAYNVQFLRGKPIFIDTLSFERARPGEPWVAYKQFCQHFLNPLVLMARIDHRMGSLLATHIDGIPSEIASQILGRRGRWSFGVLTHVHWHAASQKKHSDAGRSGDAVKKSQVSDLAKRGIVDSLASLVRSLEYKAGGTEWGDYYEDNNYSADGFEAKKKLVADFLASALPNGGKVAWDLGANRGVFTRLAAERSELAIAWDIDPVAVSRNYREVALKKETKLLPLLVDLSAPSPAIGWMNTERDSMLGRGPADVVMALALVHHLRIGNNLPWSHVVEFFRRATSALVVEFVPRDDSQVRRLLASREDIFPDYDIDSFQKALERRFKIEKKAPIPGTNRTLFLCRGV